MPSRAERERIDAMLRPRIDMTVLRCEWDVVMSVGHVDPDDGPAVVAFDVREEPSLGPIAIIVFETVLMNAIDINHEKIRLLLENLHLDGAVFLKMFDPLAHVFPFRNGLSWLFRFCQDYNPTQKKKPGWASFSQRAAERSIRSPLTVSE